MYVLLSGSIFFTQVLTLLCHSDDDPSSRVSYASEVPGPAQGQGQAQGQCTYFSFDQRYRRQL